MKTGKEKIARMMQAIKNYFLANEDEDIFVPFYSESGGKYIDPELAISENMKKLQLKYNKK